VERMYACLLAARATGRRLAIYGRSAEETARAAIERGILPVAAGELLWLDDIADHPRSELLVLVTGAQGEWRAPLARIARGEDARVRLGPGDCVIWSARVIPGGEREVGRLVNQLVDAGVQVVAPFGEAGRGMHTSGHGQRDEVAEWLDLVRPRRVLPVHGEPWHLVSHAHVLAERFPPDRLLSLRSGDTLSLDTGTGSVAIEPGATEATWIAEGGRAFVEGDPALGTRRKVGRLGAATVVVPWKDGRVAGTPAIHAIGLVPLRDTPELERRLGRELHRRLDSWEPIADEARATEKVRLTLRSRLRSELGTKPPVLARLLPLDGMVSYAELDVTPPHGPDDGADRDHPAQADPPS
jgi:ribonuclease J